MEGAMGTYKGFTDSRKKANDKYMTSKVDSLSIYVPKGEKEIIKEAASRQGVSVNKYVVDAIHEKMDREKDT